LFLGKKREKKPLGIIVKEGKKSFSTTNPTGKRRGNYEERRPHQGSRMILKTRCHQKDEKKTEPRKNKEEKKKKPKLAQSSLERGQNQKGNLPKKNKFPPCYRKNLDAKNTCFLGSVAGGRKKRKESYYTGLPKKKQAPISLSGKPKCRSKERTERFSYVKGEKKKKKRRTCSSKCFVTRKKKRKNLRTHSLNWGNTKWNCLKKKKKKRGFFFLGRPPQFGRNWPPNGKGEKRKGALLTKSAKKKRYRKGGPPKGPEKSPLTGGEKR